jgi:Ser/Thr protein kinase RdoA (MazF antagonist)
MMADPMQGTVESALALWGLGGAKWALIAARENRVYRVDAPGGTVALRLHRQAYRTDDELWSELEWLGVAAQGGLHVPAPVRASDGAFLHVIDGVQVDVLTWLNGAPMGQTGQPLGAQDRFGLFHAIGREMARLHKVSDAWTPPQGFTRCAWDRAGLLGETPLWGRFWDNPTLSPDQRGLFLKAREQAGAELARAESGLDYGLIHADLVRENVMVDDDRLQLIDFDDAGFGFRLFDVATTLIKNMGEPDYAALKAALIAGYCTERPIDMGALDLFLLLRALTYVGWIIPRMDEDGSAQRNARFITLAEKLAVRYLMPERLA